MLSSNDSIEFIPINEIIHIQGAGSYSDIYLKDNKKITVSKNLQWFELHLPRSIFYRAHKSYLINISFVCKLYKTNGGRICMINGESIPLSRSRKKEFMEKIYDSNKKG